MASSPRQRLLTLEEYLVLPEDKSGHFELQEGVLVASPRRRLTHQDAMARLRMQIDEQLPVGLYVVPAVDVVIEAAEPATVRAPDVVVTAARPGWEMLVAADVALAVEIISPGSRKVDLHLKPFEYAEAGIPNYWVVDLDPPAPTITAFALGAPGDGYRESQTQSGTLVVTEPFPMRIDVAALVD